MRKLKWGKCEDFKMFIISQEGSCDDQYKSHLKLGKYLFIYLNKFTSNRDRIRGHIFPESATVTSVLVNIIPQTKLVNISLDLSL